MFTKIKDYLLLKNLKISDTKRKNFYSMIFVLMTVLLLKYFTESDSFYYNVTLDLVALYFLLYIIIYIFKVIIISSYRKRNRIKENDYNNTTIGINTILNLFFLFFFFTGVLIRFDVDINGFLTVSGLFFAGLAWVFKEYILNITYGLILMFSNNIKIGDYVYIKNYRGIVRNITLLNTEIRTDEGDITFVPNEQILGHEIVNYTKTGAKRILFNFDVPVHKLEMKKIQEILEKEAKKDETIDSVELKIGRMKSKSVNLIVNISLQKYNFEIDRMIRNRFKEIVIDYLKK